MSLILVFDDEPQILELFEGILGDEGHIVLCARDGHDGLMLLSPEVDLVITDLVMPNKEGLETISDIRSLGWTMPIVAMTGGGAVGPSSYLKSAQLMGADAVLAKPFARGEVLTLVRSLVTEEIA